MKKAKEIYLGCFCIVILRLHFYLYGKHRCTASTNHIFFSMENPFFEWKQNEIIFRLLKLMVQSVFTFRKICYNYTEKKFLFKFKKSFFNFISSIQNKNTFRTNLNLFEFKKSGFQAFLNERDYFYNIIYFILKNIYLIQIKYRQKLMRNNLFNFIIFERRQFFL